MIASRIAAVVVVLATIAWVASGEFLDANTPPAPAASLAENAAVVEAPRFRVAVMPVQVMEHRRTLSLSGRTEADTSAEASARAAGILVELLVRRGTIVEAGEPIANLSDEAREAQVAQTRARFAQRQAEYEAKMRLVKSGNLPALNQPQIEADLAEAQAQLAQAEAEARRGVVLAPISGVVNEVPVAVGQALQVGAVVAKIVALDPMLAVIEIAERQLGSVQVGDEAQVRLVTGQTASGTVRFISPRGSAATRTYRVEVEIPNRDGAISDGVTAEVVLNLKPGPAARIPRSALTFSSEGELGVRVVREGDVVDFVRVALVEDGRDETWVSGLGNGDRVIVRGQDFVDRGQIVEPVPAQPSLVSAR